MPLIRFDVIEGRSDEELKKLLDTAHRAMVKAFGVPELDRYQVVTQHAANELVIYDTGLGYKRTNNFVLITIRSTPRDQEKKVNFYRILAELLEKECGINPQDIMVNVVTCSYEDWSFGLGEAQFLTGAL